MAPVATASAHKTDLLDDIFKTCSTAPGASPTPSLNNKNPGEDDFFNPREEEEVQEFGDFASAFGNATAAAAVPPPLAVANEFADFSSAFVASASAPAVHTNNSNSNSLLFGSTTVEQPLFNQSGLSSLTSSKAPVADLLSDLDGLSLDTPVPSGKFIVFFRLFVHKYPLNANEILMDNNGISSFLEFNI